MSGPDAISSALSSGEQAAQGILLSPAIKWGGLGAVGLSLTLFTWIYLLDPNGAPQRHFRAYVGFLERRLRLLFIWTPGSRIATAQLLAIFGVLSAALVVGFNGWQYAVALIVVAPPFAIELQRRRRVLAIEDQLDGFLLAMANALKSTPSVGDAFISLQKLMALPLRQEIELAVKEMRVGSTLEQALLLLAHRIGSPRVDSALSAVLIGRQVGGNLPKILETSAASIREIARLESVVRSKTAEGRVQLLVLSVIPAVVVYGFNSVSDHYFDPLTQSWIGYLIATAAVLFWIGAIVWARKILSVQV